MKNRVKVNALYICNFDLYLHWFLSDNLEIEEIWQLVPAVDKKLKNALKSLAKKQADLKNKRDSLSDKNQMSQKQLKDSDKEGSLIK